MLLHCAAAPAYAASCCAALCSAALRCALLCTAVSAMHSAATPRSW